MNDFRSHQPGLSTCRCTQCTLIACGALEADWEGWKDVEFAGWVRVTLFRLTGMEPPVWPDPRRDVAGCIPWFRTLGLALDFDDAEEDDDEPS